jgi:hydroxyacylglutathione hydrolase
LKGLQVNQRMKVERFLTGIISTNCYLAINEETKQAVVVDPAASPPSLMNHIKEEGLKIEAILLTHGHFDHTMGLDGFLKEYDVPVYVHEGDREMMTDPRLNLSSSYTSGYTFADAQYIQGEETLHFAGYDFEVFHTPGHTPGCCCYYVRSEGVLFSGDTLFAGSVGRSDFPGSSASELIRAIRDKLLPLPDDTHVYPGHMGETVIGHERVNNPFL